MIGVSTRVRTNRDASGALDRSTRRYLKDGATVGFNHSQDIVASEATDRGTLLQSGVPPKEQDDGSIIWGYLADHAPYVESGTRPHWAPIEPLIGWARRVLGDEQAAYAVQRKIAEEGTEGVHFVERGIERMRAWFGAKPMGAYFEEELGR